MFHLNFQSLFWKIEFFSSKLQFFPWKFIFGQAKAIKCCNRIWNVSKVFCCLRKKKNSPKIKFLPKKIWSTQMDTIKIRTLLKTYHPIKQQLKNKKIIFCHFPLSKLHTLDCTELIAMFVVFKQNYTCSHTKHTIYTVHNPHSTHSP